MNSIRRGLLPWYRVSRADLADRLARCESINGEHRGPQGPNEDVAQCTYCGRPTYSMRPAGETFGDHLPDCSLPIGHKGYCQPGGAGHPRAKVVHG